MTMKNKWHPEHGSLSKVSLQHISLKILILDHEIDNGWVLQDFQKILPGARLNDFQNDLGVFERDILLFQDLFQQ